MIDFALPLLTAPGTLAQIFPIEISTPETEDFSALLTEMVGALETPPAALPESSVEFKPESSTTKDTREKQEVQKEEITPIPFAPLVTSFVVPFVVKDSPSVKPDLPKIAGVIPEKHWQDVKRLEYSVKYETAAEPVKSEEFEKPQPRFDIKPALLPVLNTTSVDPQLADRSKPLTVRPAIEIKDAPSSVSFNDVANRNDIELIEPVRPAHYIEIPILPPLQVVRAVTMEIGDADSQVMVRIEERSGDMKLKIDAASETLRHDLETGVDSLIDDFREEDIHVSRIDIGHKSLITKISRMKEATQ